MKHFILLQILKPFEMQHIVSTDWKGGMAFDSVVNDHHILIDASPEAGGSDTGPRPKLLLLSALAGCTGMDVVPILQKMKVSLEGFNIEIIADLTEEHPRLYSHVHIIYKFRGKDLPKDKLAKTVSLSQEKYCGVSAMLRKAMKLTSEIVVEE